jgi:uncharacterized sporulation protein YeaH/YhbH (DUF444 family)
MVIDIQRKRYPVQDWNAYVLHTSDGDNFGADNPRTLELITHLTQTCSLVGYLEVDSVGRSTHKLSGILADSAPDTPQFVWATASNDRELWPALKRFFAKEDVHDAVAA